MNKCGSESLDLTKRADQIKRYSAEVVSHRKLSPTEAISYQLNLLCLQLAMAEQQLLILNTAER